MTRWRIDGATALLLATASWTLGCASAPGADDAGDADGDVDIDVDADADGDADGDVGTDSGRAGDADPEVDGDAPGDDGPDPDGGEQADSGVLPEDSGPGPFADGPCGGTTPYPWDASSVPGGRDPLPRPTREVRVARGEELEDALESARAGDHIVLASGTYSGRFVTSRDGTAAEPIVIRAETLLGARFTSTFEIASDHTVLLGVAADGAGLIVGGRFSRITRCRVTDVTSRRAIAIQERASFVRVDHCEVARYHVQGISLITNSGTEPHHLWIDHNYIHTKLPAPAGVDPNLEESIQLGEGGSSMEAFLDIVVERNLIVDNPDTDDAISLKSGANIVCGNTLVDAQGGITARGGDGNVIISNFLVDTAIKILDDDHLVVGNELSGRSILVLAGNVDGDSPPGTRPAGCGSPHRPARHVVLAGNSASLTVGHVYDDDCFRWPAEDVRVEVHDGEVTIRDAHATGVTEHAVTGETWEPPLRLEPSDVGPEAAP